MNIAIVRVEFEVAGDDEDEVYDRISDLTHPMRTNMYVTGYREEIVDLD